VKRTIRAGEEFEISWMSLNVSNFGTASPALFGRAEFKLCRTISKITSKETAVQKQQFSGDIFTLQASP
jgi:hypothetical protein